jgi:hypothetical protein
MAERRRFGREPLLFRRAPDDWMLETPEGIEVLARIRANVCEVSAVDLDEHAARIAIDVLVAKQRPRNRFGRPSLVLTRDLV